MRGSSTKERGIEILRCGAKRPMSAFADRKQIVRVSYSLSAKADIRRLRPTASQLIAAFLIAAFSFPTLLFGMRPLA